MIVSQRRVERKLSWCLRYEFEDAAAELDAVDIAFPRGAPVRGGARTWAARALDRVGRGHWAAQHRPRPGRRYDLLLVCLQSPAHLLRRAPWSVWDGLADVTACYIDDLFCDQIPDRRGEMRLLSRFDLLFMGFEGTVDAVANATGRPCRHLPFSVDTLQACPYPNPPARVIDVYALGRRREAMHRALTSMSRRRGWFYTYDTVRSAPVTSPREHRRRLLDQIKRTRYFVVQGAKANRLFETGGQEEIGYRYYEGAAAGAVLVGDVIRTPSFERLFGWEDAVIPIAPDGSDLDRVLTELEAEPARVERIRRSNVAHALLRHDHAYRWADILSAAGLKARPALDARIQRLARKAALVQPAVPRSEAPATRAAG